MTYKELIALVAARCDIPQVKAQDILDTTFRTITERARSGETVRIPNFGNFKIITRAARIGRNPSTGDVVPVPKRQALSFKMSGPLKKNLENPKK